jgi:hypothetical protein
VTCKNDEHDLGPQDDSNHTTYPERPTHWFSKGANKLKAPVAIFRLVMFKRIAAAGMVVVTIVEAPSVAVQYTRLSPTEVIIRNEAGSVKAFSAA